MPPAHDRVGLADPQVRGEVVRRPAHAQRGRVRTDLVEEVGELGALGLGKRHKGRW
jgi:hypothetical protein